MPRPLPTINRDSEPYWVSAHDHALKMQRCKRCDQFRFYPSLSCHFCGSLEFDWVPISGKGEIHTFTTVYRGPGAPFADLLPLVVAMVTLEEGPTMMSNIVGCQIEDVKIGMPVELAYEDVNDQITLPVFKPAR